MSKKRYRNFKYDDKTRNFIAESMFEEEVSFSSC